MKRILIFLLIVSLFLIGCEIQEDTPDIKTPPTDAECTASSDCITGGCSGTLCQSKDAPPMFTTCEFLPEYTCYKQIDCGCVNYKCQWEKTEEYNNCVEEARTS
tara:strand:+ start:133 stop:444 length:312 start_codon:yes stop_codon:yes gene_type:complete